MRELDTASPVVWPAWCYSGENEEVVDRGGKMTTVEGGGVKAERLSPPGDSSSRSGTPSSSYTPPGVSPTAHTPLPRNYSEFMRSLAAKYNNNHPNDYFSGRNGFGVKAGGSGGGTGGGSGGGAATKEEDRPQELGFFPPVFPPVIDMNATQALLSMVRTHAGAAHLETYLKGATKRSPGENGPLDLSSGGGQRVGAEQRGGKRAKKQSLGEMLYGSWPPRPPRRNNRCPSACSPCTPDSQAASHWSVDDVANFVATVDMCAEYAPNFREQRIDGSSLPLLTEEHLTCRLGMRLGPALKLRSILSSKFGQCPVCLHCTHCHQQPPDK